MVTRDEPNDERGARRWGSQAQELEDCGSVAELLSDVPFNVPYGGRGASSTTSRRWSGAATVVRRRCPWRGVAAELLAADAGSAEVLMTTSCTAALELSVMLMDLRPGDTVIVPSFTFTSTASLASLRQGAWPALLRHRARQLGLDQAHTSPA